MKTIAVITSTRAEFGLLMPVIKYLKSLEDDRFKADVIVTGTHLYPEYGNTIEEIRNSGIEPDRCVQIPVASAGPLDISHDQAVTIDKFTGLFVEEQYNGIVILGDRYEMLSIAIAAGNTHTPIFHLCGGDTTEGAMDEWIRHSITKMSYLHFPTNEMSYRRVLQLGESPDRVFNFGSTSIDNILNVANMPKLEVLDSLGLGDYKFAICTYHPVTMDASDVAQPVNELLDAIEQFPEIEFIVTRSNADQGGAEINRLLDEADDRIDNLHVFSSLGIIRYLSLMRHSEFVLGNSSSGIIEAPALKVPTVNIGDRQRGRLQSESIINCKEDKKSIVDAIRLSQTKEFKSICSKVKSPYGDGRAAEKIAKKIYDIVIKGSIDLKKTFFDIERR